MRLSILDQVPVSEGVPVSAALHGAVALAREADDLGYHRYWVAEHHGLPEIAIAAPEILIGLIAQATRRIRVGAGAVILPHYSALKVAEVFATLEAMFPGRIDLGLGRGPGAGPAEMYALARQRKNSRFDASDFFDQLLEVEAWLTGAFPPAHPFASVTFQPAAGSSPDLWVMGASSDNAARAGELGLPFAFAHFLAADRTKAALDIYRAHFRPAAPGGVPRTIAAVGVIAADSDEAAQALACSARAASVRRAMGQPGALPDVATARTILADINLETQPSGTLGPVATGCAGRVADQLRHIAEALDTDEIMLLTNVHDQAARLHSYRLIAQAML